MLANEHPLLADQMHRTSGREIGSYALRICVALGSFPYSVPPPNRLVWQSHAVMRFTRYPGA